MINYMFLFFVGVVGLILTSVYLVYLIKRIIDKISTINSFETNTKIKANLLFGNIDFNHSLKLDGKSKTKVKENSGVSFPDPPLNSNQIK